MARIGKNRQKSLKIDKNRQKSSGLAWKWNKMLKLVVWGWTFFCFAFTICIKMLHVAVLSLKRPWNRFHILCVIQCYLFISSICILANSNSRACTKLEIWTVLFLWPQPHKPQLLLKNEKEIHKDEWIFSEIKQQNKNKQDQGPRLSGRQ